MLDTTSKTHCTTEPDTIDGRSLACRLRRADPRQRAALAKDFVIGEKRIGRLTRVQAAALCKVPLPRVSRAVNDKPPQPHPEPKAIVAWWRSATFGERVALIQAFGPVPTWDVLSEVIS